MNQKTIILTVVLFALIVVGMFVYASLKNKEGSARTSSAISHFVFA